METNTYSTDTHLENWTKDHVAEWLNSEKWPKIMLPNIEDLKKKNLTGNNLILMNLNKDLNDIFPKKIMLNKFKSKFKMLRQIAGSEPEDSVYIDVSLANIIISDKTPMQEIKCSCAPKTIKKKLIIEEKSNLSSSPSGPVITPLPSISSVISSISSISSAASSVIQSSMASLSPALESTRNAPDSINNNNCDDENDNGAKKNNDNCDDENDNEVKKNNDNCDDENNNEVEKNNDNCDDESGNEVEKNNDNCDDENNNEVKENDNCDDENGNEVEKNNDNCDDESGNEVEKNNDNCDDENNNEVKENDNCDDENGNEVKKNNNCDDENDNCDDENDNEVKKNNDNCDDENNNGAKKNSDNCDDENDNEVKKNDDDGNDNRAKKNNHKNKKRSFCNENNNRIKKNNHKKKSSHSAHGVSGPGIIGFRNLGNTCYMNSGLQCITQSPWLISYLYHENFSKLSSLSQKPKSSQNLLKTYQKFVQDVFNDNNPNLSKFKYAMSQCSEQYKYYQQMDSYELIIILLENVHKALNKGNPEFHVHDYRFSIRENVNKIFEKVKEHYMSRDNSIVTQLFNGFNQVVETCLSKECGKTLFKFEPFRWITCSLNYETKNKEDIYDMVYKSLWIPVSYQCKDYSWKCPHCRQRIEGVKIHRFPFKMPKILIIRIGRFDFVTGRKLSNVIKFPKKNLQFSKYSYDLYGICHHSGYSVQFGHYTADILSLIDKKWYHMNDSYVSDSLVNKYDFIESSTAVVLFYRLVSDHSSEIQEDSGASSTGIVSPELIAFPGRDEQYWSNRTRHTTEIHKTRNTHIPRTPYATENIDVDPSETHSDTENGNETRFYTLDCLLLEKDVAEIYSTFYNENPQDVLRKFNDIRRRRHTIDNNCRLAFQCSECNKIELVSERNHGRHNLEKLTIGVIRLSHELIQTHALNNNI